MDIRELLNNDHSPYGSEVIGPFHEPYNYKLTVNGYLVPNITAMLQHGTEDTWNLLLDGRFVLEDVPGHQLRQWLPFLANAMAVAAGYSAHGENCEPLNPYKVKLTAFGGDE